MKGFSSSSKPNKKKPIFNMQQTINKAYNLLQTGKTNEALLLYEKLLEKNCKDPNFLSNYAVLLRRKGEFGKAIKLLTESIRLYPNRSEAYCNLSLILSNNGKNNEAINYIEKALYLSPENTIYLFNYGLYLLRSSQLNLAKDTFLKTIELSSDNHKAYAELALVCVELGELDEALISIRKAISIYPDSPRYYSNLASILTTKGEFFDAGEAAMESLNFKLEDSKPLYILSNSKTHSNNKIFLNKLFSDEYERTLSNPHRVDLYFARANVLHRQSNFQDASNYLYQANKLKLSIYPSDAKRYVRVVNKILSFSNKIHYSSIKNNKSDCIFIVGMPRSGSTLIESIISMNNQVADLGEALFLESAFVDSMVTQDINNLYKINRLYYEKRNRIIAYKNPDSTITTDKQLYNFAYIPIIASQFPDAKIIHCMRNPLDNILSIFRAHFAKESRYSSSLVDCVEVYALQDRIMNTYKAKFNNIFTLNYDELVLSPESEIRRLIEWLGWTWQDIYLNPHLNKRTVATASSVSVRSPINNKSLGGWRNYENLLMPAINEFSKLDDYKFLFQ